MRTSNSTILTVSLFVIIGLAAGSVSAAVITWDSTAYNITGDSDVVTTGTMVKAQSVGTMVAVTAATVNGVLFPETWDAPVTGFNINSVNRSANAPFSSLSSAYQSVLEGILYTQANLPTVSTAEIAGLTVGRDYLVQVWGTWSGVAPDFMTVTVSGSPQVHWNNAGAEGGLGNYVIGRFTADSASQTLTITPDGNYSPLLAAFQVRDITVPEPSTVILFGTGLIGLLAYAWRKRK